MTQKHFGYKSKTDFLTFFYCWIAYAATYVCRLNFSAATPELTREGVFSEGEIAHISSAFFVCYGLGQLLSGVIGDRLDTRRMIFLGMAVSAVCNLGLFCTTNYLLFRTLWGLNGAAQSLVWSPILKIASLNFDAKTRDKFGIDLSTTVPLGTLLSYAVSLFALLLFPWRYVFLSCGAVLLAASLVWIGGTRNLFRTKGAARADAVPNAPAKPADAKKTFLLLACSGAPLLLLPIMIQGTLKDSVTQWVPTFFAAEFGSSTVFSLALTMLLPIVNVTGAWLAKALDRRLHNEVLTALCFFVVSAVFLLLLRLFGDKSLVLSLVCMAGVTNCMFAVNVLYITIVPLHFSKSGRVSTIAGFLNAAAYIGCGALNLLAGQLLEGNDGWNRLFWLWIFIAAAATALSLAAAPLWKRFLQSDDADTE